MASGRVGRENDDYVEYFLFPRHCRAENEIKVTCDELEEIRESYLTELSQYLTEYIWQDEPFQLTKKENASSASGGASPHLYGRTYLGDNIEDEWFVVFLLRQLTRVFSDLVVRVADNDGEFLLIEAADHLKKWMKPDTCENKVYLYRGNLHILPQPQTPDQLTSLPIGVPTMSEAVTVVREHESLTKSDSKLQNAVWKRIANYPDKIKGNQHCDHCFVPAAVVAILQARPQLISAAVNAFYSRDLEDMKVCRAMKYFPPETRVMAEVRFSRCLFAQLVQHKYIPDKRTGWNLPAPNRPEFKAFDLGMKLACGFEILASKANPVRLTSPVIEEVDLEMDVRWNRYFQSIKEKGYFRDELEHSRLYDALLKNAKVYFLTNITSWEGKFESASDQVQHLLSSLEVDVDQMKKNVKTLNPPDDDSWLNVNPEQLDNLLKEYGLPEPNQNKENKGSNEESLASDIPTGLKAFVSHISSHEGAEFPKMRSKGGNQKSAGKRITFDADAFADAMQSILDFKLPDWGEEDGSSSGMSDYSDENDDIDLSKPSQTQAKSKSQGKNVVPDTSNLDMKEYMDQMDRELATTAVGQTYERTPVKTQEAAAMPGENGSQSPSKDDFDNYEPVNLDLTALKNILESYNSQQGLPGPAASLLENMGIKLPQNIDTCD